MNPIARVHRPRARLRIAAWALLCLLLQGWFALNLDVRMASAAEVCSVGGTSRTGHDEALGADCLHACCHVVASQALASTLPRWAPVALSAATLPAPLPYGRLALEWSAPLSRGPPMLEVI